MPRTLLLPTFLLLFLGIFCFFTTSSNRASNSAVTYACSDDIKTLDPGAMSWAGDIRVAMGLWEGLTANDPKTLAPIPAAAESWQISPDYKTYTFHLRKSARWSNGDPLRARDFLFAWRRVLTPSTAADYVAMLFLIQGGEDYFNLIAKNPDISMADADAAFEKVQAKALDDYTLEVHLKAPCAYFLDLTAFPPYFPLHEASMKSFFLQYLPVYDDSPGAPPHSKQKPTKFIGNSLTGYTPEWMHPPSLISNGPFQFTQWHFKQYLVLEPNPYYWDRASVHCSRLQIVAYPDAQAGILALRYKSIDIFNFVPQLGPELIDQQAKHERDDLDIRPVFGTYYYVFNCARKPFDDPRIRRALALVINKQQIVESVTRMHQRPLNVIVPPDTVPGYISPAGLSQNIPEAQRLLAAAGFPDGQGFPPIELLYNTEANHATIAQAIGQMWQNNLHVRVTYKGQERATFGTERRINHNFDVARGGWYGDYPDPTTWLDLARTDNGNNDGKYSSPAYDALMAQSDQEPDPKKRLALLAQAEKMLVEDDLPFIPLYQYTDGNLYDPAKITGAQTNIRNLTLFKFFAKK